MIESDAVTPAVADPAVRRRDRQYLGGLVAMAVLFQSFHLLRGPNFVLDDWWEASEGHFDGVFGAVDTTLGQARPGTVVAYGLSFGLFKDHPLPISLELSLVYVAVVVVLYAALRRFLDPGVAVLVAGLWVLLPNHQSLEVWSAAINISLSLLCVLLGVWVAAVRAPSRVRQATALALFAAASLLYEASIPACAALILAVPYLVERRWRAGFILAGAVTQGSIALWLTAHWHPAKQAQPIPDFSAALPGHFGWGIAHSRVADVLLVIALAGIIVAFTRVVFSSFRSQAGEAEYLVLVGIAIIVVGTVPWVRYFYSPLGAGDRVLYISGIGGALVWAGVILMMWNHRPLLLALATILVLGAVGARWDRAQIWDRAGNDGIAILHLIEAKIDEPTEPIAIGPVPIEVAGVAAFVDSSNIDRALEMRYDDRDTVAIMTFSQAAFDEHPESFRIDIREVSTLDRALIRDRDAD